MKMKMALATASLAALSVLPLLAQDADHAWSKNYPVTGKPTLNLETGDAGVQISSCGSCREIRIHIETVGIKLSEYRLEEGQTGDQVHFLFKEKPQIGVFHVTWHKSSAKVTVETPADLTLRRELPTARFGSPDSMANWGSRPAMGMSRSIMCPASSA